ncbi:hypothetical protein MNBD_GAMMA07-2043 [hydrothermal vent metagenome]|uniref:YHS domain-containing protein n=1 Tax=hydrothermal vent metagenome TaxID=652676 RepID=A0A3B0X2L9_9ZZZZ
MKIKTMICSTCGCSLVRLGISKTKAMFYEYKSINHVFCCLGCLTLFKKSPDKYIEETSSNIVCPTCLSEKPIAYSVSYIFKEQVINFCRCPYCLEAFNKKPDYYLERLAGNTDFKGLFSDEESICCH